MTTGSTELVLLDTSIWIDYFRKKAPLIAAVDRLIDEERVCVAYLVVAELLQGCKTDLEFNILKQTTQVFPLLEERPNTWIFAADLSRRLRCEGQSVGLADCYLATLAHQHAVQLWTQDRHFLTIQKQLKIVLYQES